MLATTELIREASGPGRLRQVLPRMLASVPLYQRHAGLIDSSQPDPLLLEAFRRLPTITKRDIRRGFPANFLRPGLTLEQLLDEGRVELEHTSGTSEERTPLLLEQGWWALQEARALRLNAHVNRVLDRHLEARRVTLSSPTCNSEVCYTGTPSLADRTVGATRFLSRSKHPFLWDTLELERITGETLDWGPVFLDLDPVYGAAWARYCLRERVTLPSLQFVLCSYEHLSVVHRALIEAAFRVPVYNLYGSTETGHLLMEDESGELRPSLETAWLDVPQRDAAGIGELEVTTLTHKYMPLVRYRIGDLVHVNQQPYGTQYRLHGRARDAALTPSGCRVTVSQIDECFTAVGGIVHYQLRQHPGAGEWALWLIPDATPPSDPGLGRLRRRLTDLLELEAPVRIELTDSLLSEFSGKFRLVSPQPGSVS